MGVLFRRHHGIYNLTGIGKLSLVTLILYLGTSFVSTIWAVYLQTLFDNIAYVTFFSALLSVLAFLSYFFIIPTVERNKKSSLFQISLFFIAITYVVFAFTENIFLFLSLSIPLVILITIRVASFGIIIRDKSNPKTIPRNEGLVYTFYNLAWLVGPLIAGHISEYYGLPLVFVLSAFLIVLAILVFRLLGITDANIQKKTDNNFFRNFVDFFKDKQRVLIYFISSGCNFWFVLIFLLFPVYLIDKNYGVIFVGYFIFFHSLPVTLLEYKSSTLVSKFGFKKLFYAGFSILIICAILSFIFIDDIYLTALFLCLSGVGIALIEPNSEAYFLEILKGKNEELRFYGPFNTAVDLNQLIGLLLSGLILLYVPFEFVFIMFAVAMLVFLLLVIGLKEIKIVTKK